MDKISREEVDEMKRMPNVRPKRDWKDGLIEHAVDIHLRRSNMETLGYHITWWLWSADIWIWKIPVLRSIVAVNVIVWLVLFVR